ncbi:MAG TPA: CDP-alcohol phosphatidyltransferase family protein [Kofleriaceae bacterium]|nr:CDP-alcohol phosphatidyltransferase family protein [Kofleriaceae bacterium]
MANLHAIVLAADPLSQVRIAGLSACERAVRVAKRIGAESVHVVDDDNSRASLESWWTARSGKLLVIRANQLVHTPLVDKLIASGGDAIAVVPDNPAVNDLTPGEFAGAFVVGGGAATDVVAALARGETDVAIVAKFSEPQRVPHGAIARAPIATPDERRAATRLLHRILIKPQDNAITRYAYRPVSMPLSKLLVWTPITPNQISYFVAMMVAFGCWLTAHADFDLVLLGTVVVLLASYIDCCDGEIARLKLLSSRYGAWVDTVVDELSSVGYMVALGWHCHLAFGPNYFGNLGFDPWLAATAVGVVTYLWSIYCIYYNIIVAVGSANSQDYVGRFEVVPGKQPNSMRLAPAATKVITTKEPLPQPLELILTYLPYVVRRDFICWAAVAFAALHATHAGFGTLVLGGLISFVILSIDHMKLRSLRRSVMRRGLLLEAPR